MIPKSYDWSAFPRSELHPGDAVADLSLDVDGVVCGPFRNPVFSAARASSGRPPSIGKGRPVRYSAKLKSGFAGRGAPLLLSSPILDDVTIYVDGGGPIFLGWVSPSGFSSSPPSRSGTRSRPNRSGVLSGRSSRSSAS